MKQSMIPMIVMTLFAGAASAASSESALEQTFQKAETLVNSMQLYKPGQARVFASDGSEYSGAEALWMKQHLHAAQRAYADKDTALAVDNLTLVVNSLEAHGAALGAPRLAVR